MMNEFAQQIQPVADWRDLALHDEEREILQQIVTHMRSSPGGHQRKSFSAKRGSQGNSVLFTGGSSKDRILAAGVLANELQLDLYRIDLGAMVTRYIGETEKNLKAVFDNALGTEAVLLFDEADALLGRRSEVRDAHDRYANIEVNYLLQRIQQFTGLVILSTNRGRCLDQAFTRRLRYLVEFPAPATR